ncbi:MAG: N-acyl-D-amino-acid deacylase family protein [Streptosporangiaceae bacterium]
MTSAAREDGRPILIEGAELADGSGRPLVRRDVLVADGRIAAVEPAGTRDPSRYDRVEADGFVLAPGFIDVHSHADNAPLLRDGDTTKILQGVTTEVVGNCGFSLAPVQPPREQLLAAFTTRIFPPFPWGWHAFADFLAATDTRGYVTNYVPLVGHGTLRLAVLGMEDRAPRPGELAAMGGLLDEALVAGAFGMSSGLIYPPGLFSATDELVELARHLPEGRLYATHMRGEGEHLLDSIDEAIRIGGEGNCRVQISHLKASGRPHWGRVGAALARLDRARQEGLDITQDVYPYDRSSTMLTACMPPWFQEGGDAALLARLDDPAALARARAEVEGETDGWESHLAECGYDGVLVSSTASHAHEGQTLAEVAAELGLEPFEALVEVLRGERLRASMVISSMSEADVEAVLDHPATVIGSDGLPPGVGGKPHPRLFGTFPRVLGRYVRERGLLDLPTALARMTASPADAFGLTDRGRIAPGAVADLVAFDPERVADVCDYRDPVHPPTGIAWVMQAGRVAVRDGRWLGSRLGTRLRPR